MSPQVFFCLLGAFVVVSNAQNATSVSTSTTTVRPSSVPSSSPRTTTVEPTPATSPAPDTPQPRKPDWTIKGPTGPCLLVAGNMSFSLTYKTVDGSSATGQLPIPKTATALGNCSGFLNSLILSWPVMNAGGAAPAPKYPGAPAPPALKTNMVTLMFVKKPVYDAGNDTGMGSYSLATVYGMVAADFPDAAAGQSFYISAKPTGISSGNLMGSYKCDSYQYITADKTGSAYMEFQDFQAEAFHSGATDEFGPETVCAADTLNSVLPIVAFVVGGVIVAALIATLAYLKYRRSGYAAV